METSRRSKATSCIRRAAAGTALITPRTRTSYWSGAGWARAQSRRPATKCILRATSEPLGRTAHQEGHERATRETARTHCGRREASWLESRTGRAGDNAKNGAHCADCGLPDAARPPPVREYRVAKGL